MTVIVKEPTTTVQPVFRGAGRWAAAAGGRIELAQAVGFPATAFLIVADRAQAIVRARDAGLGHP